MSDEPARRLSPLARWVWRAEQAMIFGALTVAGVIVAVNLDALGPLPWLVPAAVLVVATLAIPPLRWSRWRWDIQDDGIDIRQGTLAVRRTLVPWVRVQHVDTRRGVLEQAFGLSTVVVHTAAGGHTIPLLTQDDAESLRARIAGLARTEDD
jgi:membrane protein YdbS with pleckstrin-like domain